MKAIVKFVKNLFFTLSKGFKRLERINSFNILKINILRGSPNWLKI